MKIAGIGAAASIRGDREFLAPRPPAIFPRNEHHDHADGLPPAVGLRYVRQLPAILLGNLLTDRIAVRRQAGLDLRTKQPDRYKAERGKAEKGAKRVHDTLSSASPLNGE